MPTEPSRIFVSLRSVDPLRLAESVEALSAVADGTVALHLDIADGVFVPELSYGPAVPRALADRYGGEVEVHLMVVDPERYLPELSNAGISRVSFHLEAARYPWRVCSRARQLGLLPGVAVNPSTPIQALVACAEAADFVNVLTTEPDFEGEALLPGMVERVAAARAELPDRVLIEVDGGVDADTAGAFVLAGAEHLVVGRAITSATDGRAALVELRRRIAPLVPDPVRPESERGGLSA